MKKLLLSFAFFPLFLPAFSFISLLRIHRLSTGGDEAGKKEASRRKASLALFVPEEPPLSQGRGGFISVKNVVENSGNTTVINSTETKAEGSNARTESSVSTTVNGENVTVKTNQPGSVEVKNINGKVEIKTSQGITPTIIITKGSSTAFSEIINNRTSSIYSFLKGFFKRVFSSFLKKT